MMTTNKNHKNRNLGLYIHLPFCQRKCSYCGFLSLENQSEMVMKQYIRNLLTEANLQFDEFDGDITTKNMGQSVVDTIYLGGGTPSLINGKEMITLLEGIGRNWIIKDDAEITMESNPNSLTAENLQAYRKAGINRLSIGVQSFNDKILAGIGRLHDAQTAIDAYAMASHAGFDDINLDLMFGLPGQTLQEWKASLETAVALEPTHLSLYTLQIEEGTRLYYDYKSDKLPIVDLSVDRACYHYAIDFLKGNGYNQYEISNFSKSGYECKHNSKYWSLEDYLGLGLGASSYMNGTRWKNLVELDSWTAQIKNSTLPIDRTTIHLDTPKDAMSIFLFTGLRKQNGISFQDFTDIFDLDFFQVYAGSVAQLKQYKDQGFLDWSDPKVGSLWITEAGIDHSNEIMSEFV